MASGKPYTRDEVIDQIGHNDSKVMVKGYVDDVKMRKKVGSQQVEIQKFTLHNNDKRRVPCVIWSTPVIEQFSKLLVHGNILLISNANSKAIEKQYKKNHASSVCAFELNIGKSSKIVRKGVHKEKPAEDENLSDAKEVDFNTIEEAKGFIKIQGYIKQDFFTLNSNNLSSYASGSLTNGVEKLNLFIINAKDPYDHMIPGKKVLVYGLIRDEAHGKILQVQVKSFGRITLIEGAPEMDEDDLLEGSKSCVRKLIKTEGTTEKEPIAPTGDEGGQNDQNQESNEKLNENAIENNKRKYDDIDR